MSSAVTRPDPSGRRRFRGRLRFGGREMRSAGYATVQQGVSLVASAVTGVVLARALTNDDFGLYSVAVSLATIGASAATGGIGALGIKMLLDDPPERARTMSAFVVLREGLALLTFLVLLGVAALTTQDATVPTAIAAIALFAKALDTTDAWFQSEVRTGVSSAVRIAVVVATLGARLGFAAAGSSVTTFLLLYVAEAALSAVAVVVTYLRSRDSPGFGRPEPARAVAVLARSWPLMLANLARQVNLRADVVIVAAVAGTGAAGTYSVAARLSEIAYFLPVVFTTATFPSLLALRRAHGPDSAVYEGALQRSYDRACWIGAVIAAVTFVAGPPLIDLVYGERYAAAGDVLRIHVLALPFVFMSAVLAKWLVAEELLLATLPRQIAGALVNVALNLALVPEWGIRGAAVATVVSYTVSSYLFCFVGGPRVIGGGPLRTPGRQMSRALVWPLRIVRRRRAPG